MTVSKDKCIGISAKYCQIPFQRGCAMLCPLPTNNSFSTASLVKCIVKFLSFCHLYVRNGIQTVLIYIILFIHEVKYILMYLWLSLFLWLVCLFLFHFSKNFRKFYNLKKFYLYLGYDSVQGIYFVNIFFNFGINFFYFAYGDFCCCFCLVLFTYKTLKIIFEYNMSSIIF